MCFKQSSFAYLSTCHIIYLSLANDRNFFIKQFSRYDYKPQIYKGDPRPCILPCVMALSAMGLKLGVFRFFADHTRKNKHTHTQKCAHDLRAPFYECLSSRRWYTHLTNHGYFDYGKNPKTPNLSPMLG